ncbi:MAG: isoprenylcysteine carboxylmethyltransferase family protein [Nitrospiraceae bacterium]|nr:isoprenylcysteine carboxylmethyltransferase family protein [Nitrospiraceae bacterium]
MPRAILAITLIFVLFAVLHSLLAADRTKRLAIKLAGSGSVKAFYRLFYVALSAVSAVAAFYLIGGLPDVTIWRPPIIARALMSLVQLAGLVLGLAAFSGMDALEFVGIRQALRRLKAMDEAPGDEEGIRQRLVTGGLYGVIRHPLYTAGILVFTFVPVLTRNRLTVSALADLYFIYGALIEEKRLLKRFGQEYREYMKKVPRFIPRI